MTAPDSSSLSPQAFENLDSNSQTSLADTALRLAQKSGAGYADIRIGRNQDESAYAREDKLQHFNSTFSAGFGVRVLLDGSWGFASSRIVTEAEVARTTAEAIENAKAARLLQTRPIELEETFPPIRTSGSCRLQRTRSRRRWRRRPPSSWASTPRRSRPAQTIAAPALDRARGKAVRKQPRQPHSSEPGADLAPVHRHGHR